MKKLWSLLSAPDGDFSDHYFWCKSFFLAGHLPIPIVQCPVLCDRPVVIKRQHAEFHECLWMCALLSGTAQEKIIPQAANPGE
jgi:hypothetical protein